MKNEQIENEPLTLVLRQAGSREKLKLYVSFHVQFCQTVFAQFPDRTQSPRTLPTSILPHY